MAELCEYLLVECFQISKEEIIEYYEEFKDADEDCYVLWLLKEMSIDEWYQNAADDRRTRYVGMYAGSRLVGIGRITTRLNKKASGAIGYAIRPSERGKGYASEMIKLMEAACEGIGVERTTACVDAVNEKSIRAFKKAGWVPSGRQFDWKPNPGPRKAIEFVPGKQSKG